MKRFVWILMMSGVLHGQAQNTMNIYLIPGQGGDARLFSHLNIEGPHTVRHVRYDLPEKGLSMRAYAAQLVEQIDVNEPFVIIGVSLGGMIAAEMSELVDAEKVILISSAKSWNELPGRYRFQRRLPIYKIVSPRMSLFGAKVLQPIVEPDRQSQKDIFKAMLRDKDPKFIARTIPMIMEWERTEAPANIYHIHGSNDHTIPIGNVDHDHCVEGGSHMMVLTDSERVSAAVNEVLAQL